MEPTAPIQASSALGRLHLLGPIVLSDMHGNDCTPPGRKAQALIALLALSPRGTRTRAWIRDKLWSDSTDERSSSSLRQTVFEIKKSLGDFADTYLAIDRYSIQLRLDRIWVDVRVLTDNPGNFDFDEEFNKESDLLEGIDVRDEEFEEWLLMERRNWEDKRENLEPKIAAQTPALTITPQSSLTLPKRRISIGILPSIRHGCSEQSAVIADHLIEAISRNIVEFYPNDILDFRDTQQGSEERFDMLVADYFVRARILEVMGSLTITLFVYRSNTTELVWSQSIQTSAGELMENRAELLNQFVAQNVDRLARSILRETSVGNDPSSGPQGDGYSALMQMFDLDDNALDTSATLLQSLSKEAPNPLYDSLLAYSDTFRVGENVGSKIDSLHELTWERTQNALKQDTFNAIALASTGHVLGYMFGKHEMAAELFKKAIQLNPTQAFVWDHLALHCLYTGRLDQAENASRRAVSLGAYSPLKYSYETTSCMIASLRGQHERAVALGMSALSKQPRFTAAMRYTLASCGHLKRFDQAEKIAGQLKLADPEFFDRGTQKQRFRLPLPNAEEHVLTGVQRAGY